MADTDSDSEIQFNIVNDVNEEGQGDVIRHSPVPMLNPDDPVDDDNEKHPCLTLCLFTCLTYSYHEVVE